MAGRTGAGAAGGAGLAGGKKDGASAEAAGLAGATGDAGAPDRTATAGAPGGPAARPLELWPLSRGAAIFDFDGTLAETWDLWHEVDEVFFASRGLPFDEDSSLTLATLGFEPGARWCVEHYRLREDPAHIVDEWNRLGSALYRSRVRLRPGAEAYLRRLRAASVPLALATTNDPQVLDSMEHVRVRELFDAVVCGREVARGKDAPDIYLEAAARLGATPEGCVVFEDILPGIRSAAGAGMATCAVLCDDPRQRPQRAALADAADLLIADWLDPRLGGYSS